MTSYDSFNPVKNLYPLGPAPRGWTQTSGCSWVIPHNEGDWTDADLNLGHYKGVAFIVIERGPYWDGGDAILGVFTSVFDAEDYLASFDQTPTEQKYVPLVIEAWWRDLQLTLPDYKD